MSVSSLAGTGDKAEKEEPFFSPKGEDGTNPTTRGQGGRENGTQREEGGEGWSNTKLKLLTGRGNRGLNEINSGREEN